MYEAICQRFWSLVVPVGQAGQSGRGWDGYRYPCMWDGTGWWSPLLWLLFMGVVIAALVMAFRGGRGKGPSAGNAGRDPLDIVRERYAKGEITREEFERMKQDLKR